MFLSLASGSPFENAVRASGLRGTGFEPAIPVYFGSGSGSGSGTAIGAFRTTIPRDGLLALAAGGTAGDFDDGSPFDDSSPSLPSAGMERVDVTAVLRVGGGGTATWSQKFGNVEEY